MGEIRIKSENLYTIELGDDRWRTMGNGQIIPRADGVLQIEMTSEKNSGVYALSTSAIGQLSDIRSTVSYIFDIRADTDISVLVGYEVPGARVLLQVSNEWVTVKVENILFTQSYNFTIVNRSSGGTVYVRNFMLNEGSTALPYQPYFLNKPAHQVTNGQFVDIPTHHYINNRWQGELTSQSPLKFRADGEMLDWRVEGKTSGNLFDIGITINDYERTYSIISVDGSSISMKYEASGMTYHYRTHNITTTGTVTIYCKGLKAKPQLLVRLRSMDDTKWLTNSDVTISGMAYNNVYNGWYGYAGSDTFIKTIIIPECLYWNMGVGFNSGGTVGEAVTISNPMVISGAYTSETIPPYEPYGGVGDWDETAQRYKIPVTVNGVTTNLYTDHQLMDGDSIDYTTDQTAIPIATGNNTLSVDTAVQPSKVFIKFEG